MKLSQILLGLLASSAFAFGASADGEVTGAGGVAQVAEGGDDGEVTGGGTAQVAEGGGFEGSGGLTTNDLNKMELDRLKSINTQTDGMSTGVGSSGG